LFYLAWLLPALLALAACGQAAPASEPTAAAIDAASESEIASAAKPEITVYLSPT
jgi:hypothetical protein